MALSAVEKQQIIFDHKRSESDTGSVEVQVALLSADIKKLTEHFKTNKHDNHSKRGLIQKVNDRRSLLRYLKKIDEKRYSNLIEKLELRDLVAG